MRYEVLIMVVGVGAINLIGQWLAKRAEAGKLAQSGPVRASGTAPPPAPTRVSAGPGGLERPIGGQARRGVSPPVAQKSSASPSQAGRSGSVAAREVRVSRVTSPEARVASPEDGRAATRRDAGGRKPGVPSAVADPRPVSPPSQRIRWNAKSIRAAFVASEILGRPAALRG